MKKFFLAAMILLCITCAGCMQTKFNLIITSDGAVVRNWKIIGTAPFSRQIENMKANNERLFPNLQIKPVSEGDMLGYEFNANYPDIENFAQSYSEMFGVYTGKNKGIRQRRGWFFDAYNFNFRCFVSRENLPPETEHITQSVLNALIYELKIQLPYSAESSDADEISADGKILRWNLAPLLIKGGERYMNAQFKIWHREKIFLTALAELLLAAATIFFFVKARSKDLELAAKDLRFKRNVFAGLFVALAIISAYMLLAPITFTDADIISAVVQ